MRLFLFSILLSSLLAFSSGCIANHYKNSYIGEGGAKASKSGSLREKRKVCRTGKHVKLRYSLANDASEADSEFLDLIESGYEFLGSSQFSATHCPWSCAIDLAKEIGATFVLLREKYSGEEMRTGIMVLPSISYSSGNWNTHSSGWMSAPQNNMYSFQGSSYGSYSGTTTTYNTSVYNYSVKVYEQFALFFKERTVDENFYGVFINMPTFLPGDDETDSVELKILAVLENSQAWKDGIRRGDIVKSLNGLPIKQRGDIQRFIKSEAPITMVTVQTEEK